MPPSTIPDPDFDEIKALYDEYKAAWNIGPGNKITDKTVATWAGFGVSNISVQFANHRIPAAIRTLVKSWLHMGKPKP